MKAEYIRHVGTDLDVVNNARVSFDKESEWELYCVNCGELWPNFTSHVNETCCDVSVYKPRLKAGDKGLIRFLANGKSSKDLQSFIDEVMLWSFAGDEDDVLEMLKEYRRTPTHWAPFANGIRTTFRIDAPFPIMRQLFKHKVGAEESEVSRRYIDTEPDVFFPEWRWEAESVKQGSGDLVEGNTLRFANVAYEAAVETALESYRDLRFAGICPEQARFVLPQGCMTTAIVSHSLYGWANLYNARADRDHAQGEVADIADMIGKKMSDLFPVSWEALTA